VRLIISGKTVINRPGDISSPEHSTGNIDLDPPPPPTFYSLFAAWATAANLPPAHSGLLDTPYGDGVPNLLRFALALPANGPLSATHLPVELDQGRLLLTYTRRAALPAVQIYDETSNTLAPGSWSQTGVQETVLSSTDGIETMPMFSSPCPIGVSSASGWRCRIPEASKNNPTYEKDRSRSACFKIHQYAP
jgi:hypothetical protein